MVRLPYDDFLPYATFLFACVIQCQPECSQRLVGFIHRCRAKYGAGDGG